MAVGSLTWAGDVVSTDEALWFSAAIVDVAIRHLETAQKLQTTA